MAKNLLNKYVWLVETIYKAMINPPNAVTQHRSDAASYGEMHGDRGERKN